MKKKKFASKVRFYFLATLFLYFFTPFLFGGEERDYTWIKLQQGIEHFNNKNYGDAMVLFSQCQEFLPNDADVAYWIGRVYEVEGDFQLAIKQYEKALNSYNLEPPGNDERIYETILHLADVNLKLGNEEQFLASLSDLLDKGTLSSPEERVELYTALESAFNKGGLDKVLELYRLHGSFEHEIYWRKADYYYQEKEFDKAKINLMLGIVSTLSVIIREIEETDIEFIFTNEENAQQDINIGSFYTSIPDLLIDVAREDYIRDFIETDQLISNLYQFADILYQQGDVDAAIDVLWTCIKYPYNEQWSRNANRLFMEISAID